MGKSGVKTSMLWHLVKSLVRGGRPCAQDIVLKTGKQELDLTLLFFRKTEAPLPVGRL